MNLPPHQSPSRPPLFSPLPRLKVLFVCRGSVQDGMGHVTRSRTVATVMQQTAWVKFVVIGDRCVDTLLTNRNINYTIVETEAEAIHLSHQFCPDIVIFDLLRLEYETFQILSQASLTVSLSPIFNWLSKVDLIFHRTKVQGQGWTTEAHQPVIKSGLDYAIISEHCYRIPDEVYQHNLNLNPLSIAISMGGADAANKTLQVLETVKHVPRKLLVWVMLGEGYTHSYQDLVDSIKGSKHEIILAKTNDSMWRILSTCTLAILAGGTTTYESSYAGLPSINTLETEKHYFLIQELIEKEICICAGSTFKQSLDNINELILHLSDNHQKLFKMHQNSKALIDGHAAERIVHTIYSHFKSFCFCGVKSA